MRRNHGYSKKRFRKDRHGRKSEKAQDLCPICGRPIKAIVTAIVHKETGKKAHFDCIIKELKKLHCLNSNDSICYLGKGVFGIVEMDENRKGNFIIKKRIQYEER